MKRSHRQVSLILNEDVEGVGFAGALVTVRAGYARNNLLPKSLAVVATPQLQAERQTEITKAEARREKEVAERQAVAESLAAEPLAVKLKVGPSGRVFGSVTPTEFVKQVKTQRKVDLDPKKLHGLPVAGLGSHTVSAKLGLGVVAQITLQVTGEKALAAKTEKKSVPATPKEPATT
ncbi:50S ribosomal protein L9 [Patescibacteria group bacterium]|nr:50S ribosomal protein L9 [Patescibacteria group bacterium]